MSNKKLNGTVIVTYRCNARCNMCNRYKCPSKPEEELSIETIKKLPKMYFTNITGGEPFIREDLPEIVRELYKKSEEFLKRGISIENSLILSFFTFSNEEDTASYDMYPKVHSRTAKRRYNSIMKEQEYISLNFNQSLIGKKYNCINK